MDKSLEHRHSKTGKLRLKERDGTKSFKQHSIERNVNKLSVCGLTTLKRVFDSGTRLHCHLRATTETIEGYPREYCAVFYLGIIDSLNQQSTRHRDLNQSSSRVSNDTDSFDFSHLNDDLDKAMFIGVINVSEERQRRIPCLIRLQALDSCPLDIGQSVFGTLSDVAGGISFEETFFIPDGEFDVSSEQRLSEKPKLPNQMVKRRPQVVADIANEQGKAGWDVFNLLKPEQALSCLSLSYKVIDDSIGLTLQEPLHQAIDDLEMFVCSVDFEKRAIERMHMLKYPQGETNARKETKDSKGARDSRAHKGRFPKQPQKGCQEVISLQSEEVKSQISPNRS